LDLPGSLVRGVLDTLHSLSGLVGDAPERALTLLVLSLLVLLALLSLVAFAHLLSLRRTNGLSAERLRSVVSRSLRLGRGVRLASTQCLSLPSATPS